MAKKNRSEVPSSNPKNITPAPNPGRVSIMAGFAALALLVEETKDSVQSIVQQSEARKSGPSIKSARILPALNKSGQVVNHNLAIDFDEDADIFVSVPFGLNKQGKHDLQPEVRTAGDNSFITYHTMEYLASVWFGKPSSEQGKRGGVYLMQNLPMSQQVIARFRAWLNALDEKRIEALKAEGVVYSRKVLEKVVKTVDGQSLVTTEETTQNLFCVPICLLSESLYLYSWVPDEKGIVQFNADDPQSWALSDKPNWVNITLGRSTRVQTRYLRGGPNPKNSMATNILKNMVSKAMEQKFTVDGKEITLSEHAKTLRGEHGGSADPRNFTRQERQAPAIRRGQVDSQAPDARQFTSRPQRAPFADDTTVTEGQPVAVDGDDNF